MKKEKIISVPIEISARHVHLSKQGLEELFGAGYELHKIKQLGQQSDFSSQETIDIIAGDRIIGGVRVVGPLRQKTQVEISKTDAFSLGLNPPLRLSGDLKGSAGVVLKGPKGKLELKEGLILAHRHLHCSVDQAKEMKIKNGDIICVKTEGERQLIFCNIIARVANGYDLCLHFDTDEGNAAGINRVGNGVIL